MSRFQHVLDAIDRANAADPHLEDGQPAALLYGRRMSVELQRWVADPSEMLRIAARGQHVERWLLPRTDYPDGLEGYLAWRREQARRHALRIGGMMTEAGYPEADVARIGTLLRKEGLKRDAEVQALEDVICFTFLRWYLGPFAETRADDSLHRIIEKTARKMSARARTHALTEFAIPAPYTAAFHDPT